MWNLEHEQIPAGDFTQVDLNTGVPTGLNSSFTDFSYNTCKLNETVFQKLSILTKIWEMISIRY